MQNPQPGYAPRFDAPDYAASLPVPFVRASLGGRTMAYLLDILFIFGFTVLLTLLITVVGVVTFGLGWTLFAVLPASGIIYSAITVGGAKQSTIGQRLMGLRTIAPESGARLPSRCLPQLLRAPQPPAAEERLPPATLTAAVVPVVAFGDPAG